MTQKGRGSNNTNSPDPKKKQPARSVRLVALEDRPGRAKYRIDPKKVADKMVEDAIRDIRSKHH